MPGVVTWELETGDLPLETRITYRLMGCFASLMPKTTRTESLDRGEE